MALSGSRSLRALLLCLTLPVLVAPAPALARRAGDPTASVGRPLPYAAGQLLVRFSTEEALVPRAGPGGIVELGLSGVDRLNREVRVTAVRPVFSSPRARRAMPGVFLLTLPAEADVESVARRYAREPGVAWAEPNRILPLAAIPDDPRFHDQWPLHQLSDHDIDAPEAWDVSHGDPGTVIAVLDTGVAWGHPDLEDNVWINPGEILDGLDNDGNGFIDDIRGWDFVDTDQPVYPGEDGTVRDNDPDDFYGHGTPCAGIAGAVTDNARGVAGVCRDCRVMAVRIGFAGPAGGGWLEVDDAADAIAYAVDNGAQILSLSWGRERTQGIEDAVGYADAAGVVLIAAAGNDDEPSPKYPAGHAAVIAVAATDITDAKASFSNHGSWVDVAAPGKDVHSTYLHGGYVTYSGTSMAVPHVSGVAGLILSRHPGLTPLEVRTILRSTVDPVDAASYVGLGRINAHAAVRSNEIPIAHLTPAFEGETIAGPVAVAGTAAGSGFQGYELSHGSGVYPATWSPILASSTPVEEASLGTWDTRTVPDGPYTVRLEVIGAAGQTGRDVALLTTDNVRVSAPRDHEIVPWGGLLEIHGSAGGPVFSSFDVEWGYGEDPSEWLDTGIALVGGGTQAVEQGLLAAWDTTAVPADSVVTIRLSAQFVGFDDTERATGVRLDSTLVPGWPVLTDRPAVSSPMAAPLDGSAPLAIVVLAQDGRVDVRDAAGNLAPGWPVDSAGGWQGVVNSTPALADLDGDGSLEIVVAGFEGRLQAYGADGTVRPGWPVDPAGVTRLYNSPTVADLDGDGQPEILQRSDAGLLVFAADGSELARWAVGGGDHALATADVDGDGDLEIATVDTELHLLHHDGTPVDGWPRDLLAEVAYGGAAIGDLDGDGAPEICVASRAGLLYTFEADGTPLPGSPRAFAFAARARPALADVDEDGALDVVVSGSYPAYLQVLRWDGSSVPGWPKSTPFVGIAEVGWSPAAVGDVDADGSPEVFAVSEATAGYGIEHPSRIHAWHADGSPLAGWPKTLPVDGAHSAPALVDVDADGRHELVVVDEAGTIYLFDLAPSAPSAPAFWPMLQYGPRHRSASPFLPYEACGDGADNDLDGLLDCEDEATCAGMPCQDGNACTESDTCSGGACVGAPVACDDGEYCNGGESCDPLTGCVAGADPCPDRPCDEPSAACVDPPWWDAEWTYRKRLDLVGATDGDQVPLRVHDEDGHDDPLAAAVDCEGHCNEDFSDLRFVADGRPLAHWVQDVEPGSARVWIHAVGDAPIFMYYGNGLALSAADGAATFAFFDDFAVDSLAPGTAEGRLTATRAIPGLAATESFEAVTRMHAVAGHDATLSDASVGNLGLLSEGDDSRFYVHGYRCWPGEYQAVDVDDGSGSPLGSLPGGHAYADGADYTVSLVRSNEQNEVRGRLFAYGDRFDRQPPLHTETVSYPDDGYEFEGARYRLSAGVTASSDAASIVHDPLGELYELTGDAASIEVRERVHWVFVRRWRDPEPAWQGFGPERHLVDGAVACCRSAPQGACSPDEPVDVCTGWVVDRCCGDDNSNGVDDGCEVIGLRVGAASLEWTARSAAVGYDVVRGDLALLLGSAGDFSAAVVECLAADAQATVLSLESEPASGEAHWYLVRGLTTGAAMTWGVVSACGDDARDAGIDAATAACP